MSAFVVSAEHVDALVHAAVKRPPHYGSYTFSWYWNGEHHKCEATNASEVGAMLQEENVRSVEHRYSPPGREEIYGEGWESDTLFELPGTYREEAPAAGVAPVTFPDWLTPYTYRPILKRPHLSPVAVLKLISCFEYQSCEHDGWQDSNARAFCESLRSKMISCLPGYSDAEWSL